MFNIIKLNAKDNIAVAPMNIPMGSEINSELKSHTNIPFGHKISLVDIKKGDLIYKYGQIIGIAFEEIKKVYRVKRKEFHPDALISKGLPEELIEKAKEKFIEIQAAFEIIEKEKK